MERSAEGGGGIIKHLQREADGADYLVLWLDCDREGENICFEVISCVDKHMNKGVKGQRIFRAKFSAVTPKDIDRAMNSLGSPNENESKAVEARQELDLKVGVAFSRFQTRYFNGKYGDLDSSVISYGPCQTPTLGFCVDRYDEIQSFQPEDFFYLDMQLDLGFKTMSTEWSRKRLFDQQTVDIFSTIVMEDGCAVCTSIATGESRKTRPKPLNTVELLKQASKTLGIGPHEAMKSAESLYLSGYLSYPRTESTSYPSSFNVREALHDINNHWSLGDYVGDLLKHGFTRPREGVDVGDHPPITPVGVPAHGLAGVDSAIYDMVMRHFLATVSPDAKFATTKAIFQTPSSKETFVLRGRKELDPGFMVLFKGKAQNNICDEDEEEDDDVGSQELPELTMGKSYRIVSAKVKKGQTSAPGYLTESELIGQMEKNGIGTDASIPTHINNIMVRNYVTLGPGRTLIPTTLGTILSIH